MTEAEKKRRLIASIARSMEAEGFDPTAVKEILEEQLGVTAEE